VTNPIPAKSQSTPFGRPIDREIPGSVTPPAFMNPAVWITPWAIRIAANPIRSGSGTNMR
jgi:hypothetical protein